MKGTPGWHESWQTALPVAQGLQAGAQHPASEGQLGKATGVAEEGWLKSACQCQEPLPQGLAKCAAVCQLLLVESN